jgi:hypothetical protein
VPFVFVIVRLCADIFVHACMCMRVCTGDTQPHKQANTHTHIQYTHTNTHLAVGIFMPLRAGAWAFSLPTDDIPHRELLPHTGMSPVALKRQGDKRSFIEDLDR